MTWTRSREGWSDCFRTRSFAPSLAKRENYVPRRSAGIGRRSKRCRSCTGSGIRASVESLSAVMRDRISVLALLAASHHDYVHLARPLLRSMEASQRFDLRVVTDPNELEPHNAQVMVAASDHPLLPGQAAQLTDFVRRGGGLVLLHGTLAAWAENLTELAGWAPSGPGPLTELIVRPHRRDPVRAAWGPELKFF